VAETLLRDLFVHLKQNTAAGDEALIRMEYGCLLLNSNKSDEALEELAHAINLYEQDGRVLEVCAGRLWLVAAKVASGETDANDLQLTELLTATKGLKELAPLYAAAAEVHHWLEKYNLPQKTLAPLRQIFTRADEFTKSIPSIRRNLRRISKSAFISPPHTTIHAFGPAQVFVNGNQVTLSDWQTRETRDLFFFFLESKPKTKEEIAAIFWPDISPARLKMRFKTSLYRLRHAVGQYTILFEGERYRFNHDIDYEYDLETYNELLEKARSEQNAAKSAELLQAAVDLVKGPYLVDVETEWADTERSQFEMQYHSTLMRLAVLYLESGQPARVIEICQTALTHNRMLEEAYQLMMRAYGLLGDRAGVARVYKTCSKILNTDLGIKPSRETEKLYQYLI
jgi:two-component SAPR family response regulator